MRRYQLMFVSNQVYCSSSGHYGVDVRCKVVRPDGGVVGMESRNYCPNDGCFWSRNGHVPGYRPKYLARAIHLTLRKKLAAGELLFFEYDRDGKRRWDDLKYHQPEHFEWLIREEKGVENPI